MDTVIHNISVKPSSIARFFLVPESKNVDRIRSGIEAIKRDISGIAKGDDQLAQLG